MSVIARARIAYSVGSEANPGDPFGRSELTIGVDGSASLEHFARTGRSAWRGTVAAEALERFWRGLEVAGFPNVAKHPVPAGSTIRTLAVGIGEARKAAHVTWHAAPAMPGYNVALEILDTVVRQLSQDSVQSVPASELTIVESIVRLP